MTCFKLAAVVNTPKSRRRKVNRSSSRPRRAGVPADVERLYGDIVSLIENNGEVTLPPMPLFELNLTNRQKIQTVGFLVATVGLIVLLKIARRIA